MDEPRPEGVPFMEMYQVGLLFGATVLFLSARRLVRSALFYYLAGSLIGVFFSVFVLVYMLAKMSPVGLSTATTGTFLAGYAISSYAMFMMWEYLWSLALAYQTYFMYYVATSASLSCLYCYWQGPPTSPRTYDVMQWALQLISTLTIYMVIPEHTYGVTVIAVLLLIAFIRGQLLPSFYKMNDKIDSIRTRWFPKPRKLLTEEEYEREADEYTRRELERLRAICRSPDSESFRMYARVRNPRKLARFVEGTDSHVSPMEVSEYHSMAADYFDYPDDTDELQNQYRFDSRRGVIRADEAQARDNRHCRAPASGSEEQEDDFDVYDQLSRTAPVDRTLRRIVLPGGRSTPRRRY